MKKSSGKIWLIIAAYLAAGYVFTSLYRLRFLLIVFVIILVLTLFDLKKRPRSYGVIGLFVLAFFFFKIIPSLYPYLIAHHFVMSLAVALTVLELYLSVLAAELAYYFCRKKSAPKK